MAPRNVLIRYFHDKGKWRKDSYLSENLVSIQKQMCNY